MENVEYWNTFEGRSESRRRDSLYNALNYFAHLSETKRDTWSADDVLALAKKMTAYVEG